jgi:hypothetical protein
MSLGEKGSLVGVTAALRRLHDRDVALGRPLVHPALKLVGEVAPRVPRRRV